MRSIGSTMLKLFVIVRGRADENTGQRSGQSLRRDRGIFQRFPGDFQHQAQREPVEITRHGRRELVLMSADHYDWLVAAARRTFRTAEAAPVVIDAVRRAAMDRKHAHLDDLLK